MLRMAVVAQATRNPAHGSSLRIQHLQDFCGARTKTMTEREYTEPPFCEIALRYLDGLYGYAMGLTGNHAASEDLLQETYLRAIRAFGQPKPESNLKIWLFTILRNAWLNHERRDLGDPRMVDTDEKSTEILDAQGQSSDYPLTPYVTKVRNADVRSAVEGLPVVEREVVLLREFADLSYQEIAEVLDCPIGTVMSRLGRARETLRCALEHWGR
jgi:RNA polymerase sigma-70 factor (ECF subfamily)